MVCRLMQAAMEGEDAMSSYDPHGKGVYKGVDLNAQARGGGRSDTLTLAHHYEIHCHSYGLPVGVLTHAHAIFLRLSSNNNARVAGLGVCR